MSDPISINLVKSRKPHFLDRFITWALNAGRLLVIITETVALSAFLFRFGLDREIVDLNDKIKQNFNECFCYLRIICHTISASSYSSTTLSV